MVRPESMTGGLLIRHGAGLRRVEAARKGIATKYGQNEPNQVNFLPSSLVNKMETIYFQFHSQFSGGAGRRLNEGIL